MFKKPANKIIRKLIFIAGIAMMVVALIILFISPITKYLIEKYDEKYTGRKITLGWVYVNPFSGYIHLNELKIFELKSDRVFFSSPGVSADFSMLKLFSGTYEISGITLDRPRGIIIRNKKDFNFNDLIEKFSSKESSPVSTVPVHFNILNLKINNGEFYYQEKLFPINYFIKKVNFETSGIRWNEETISARFSFLSGPQKGDAKGDITINLKNLDYRFTAVVHKFDLAIIQQYLKELTNQANFSANLDANVKASGNFNDAENISAKGIIVINDFHFGKKPNDDCVSFDKLVLAINELNPKNHKYFCDSISLDHPYFKYELYDHLDNFQSMFGKNGSNISSASANPAKFNLVIEIANYIKILSRNFFQSNYQINRLAIYKGDLKFNDYSLSEKFSMDLDPIYIIADSINKSRERVNILFKSGLKPYGNAVVSLSINPKDSGDFEINYHIENVPVSIFNPYLISYTSFPVDRGTIEINGNWTVTNGFIQSKNHLVIIDPRVTQRLKNQANNWIPVPLIMSFVRERGNVIDYQIPITGNLKNPKFHLNDAFFDLLKNVFVKPPTTPYGLQIRSIERKIEKALTLKWRMRNNSLQISQEKFINRIGDFLVKNPDASITVYSQDYAIKEKEYILFFEAKKKYFLATTNKSYSAFNEEDSVSVDKMSVKDKWFLQYLKKETKDSMLFTVQEKCYRVVDSAIINSRFNRLKEERKNAFIGYFKKRELEQRVNFIGAESIIPYNGYSFYKIEYLGEIPGSLKDAFRKMDELNDITPRRKFKKERKQIGSSF